MLVRQDICGDVQQVLGTRRPLSRHRTPVDTTHRRRAIFMDRDPPRSCPIGRGPFVVDPVTAQPSTMVVHRPVVRATTAAAIAVNLKNNAAQPYEQRHLWARSSKTHLERLVRKMAPSSLDLIVIIPFPPFIGFEFLRNSSQSSRGTVSLRLFDSNSLSLKTIYNFVINYYFHTYKLIMYSN